MDGGKCVLRKFNVNILIKFY